MAGFTPREPDERGAGGAREGALPITIRQAAPADADTLAAFNAAMAEETEGKRLEPAVIGRGVRRILREPALGRYYVAEMAGWHGPGSEPEVATGERTAMRSLPVAPIIGQLLVTFEFSDWRDGLFWWIQSVYVRPEARRLGVYAALHRHVEREARASGGACGLRLYVDKRNTRAQQVYRRLGLVPTEYDLYETDWSGEAK